MTGTAAQAAARATAVPWVQAWERALYGPDGFFLREAPADHFRTSVTATPVFAAAVRELAGRVDEALGRPDPFDVVDVGAGCGELLDALPDVPARWRLVGVDLAPRRSDHGWRADVPECTGLLVAHEWLDDVPCDVLFDGRVVEVDGDGTESLGESASEEALAWTRTWWPQGRRVEVGLTRDRAWAHAVRQVQRGLAVAVDYGHVLGDRGTFGDRRPSLTGWLRGRPTHPVPDGSCDITAHVALDSLAAALARRHRPARLPRPAAARRRGRRAPGPPGLRRVRLGGAARRDPGPARVTFLLTAALGATTGDVVLQLGATHPSTHGALRLHLELDGDVVVRAEPEVGFLHRGAEKLFEVRDYRQIVVLANRHDWLSAFSNELGVVLAVERMLGTAVPERAVWLRTLLAEVNRVLNHLAFLGSYPLELGDLSPALAAHSSREALQRVLEEASGGRVHDMLNRVGGLKEDVPEGWTGRLREALDGVRVTADVLQEALLGSEDFLARTTGVGVLAPEHVLSHGASGPVARASGVDLDLRRDDPYLAYAELGFGGERLPVVLGHDGDALARFRCLLEQVRVSLDLAHACLDALPAGPVAVRMPKTVRAPEGSTYVWTENPLGTMGYLLVSRGATTPWRLAMRTASFGNVSVLPVLLPGTHLRDVVTVLASLFFVVGDVDK